MVLNRIILSFIFLFVCFSCKEKQFVELNTFDVSVNVKRNIAKPDDITYYFNYKDTLDINEIVRVEIIDSNKDSIVESTDSFKLPFNFNNNALKIRTSNFINSFKDSISLRNYLLRNKLRIKLKNEKLIYFENPQLP